MTSERLLCLQDKRRAVRLYAKAIGYDGHIVGSPGAHYNELIERGRIN